MKVRNTNRLQIEKQHLPSTKTMKTTKEKYTKNPALTASEKEAYGNQYLESISVDAACAGNPGKMEYRGVLTHNKQQLFLKGPYLNGTNNIGEFLALVHGIALLKSKKKNTFLFIQIQELR